MKGLLRNLKKIGYNFVPFITWWEELKSPSVIKADVIAGITVALILIPQSMAYAQLAGLPLYYGLYASFLPVIIAALFGSSRQLQTGPVSVVSLLTASALGPLATSPDEYLAYAVSLALIVGVMQLILGLVRLGTMVSFLSHPVVLGFTNAAAIVIATTQLSKIFGVSVESADYHYETIWHTMIAAMENPHWPTVGIAVLALTIMLGLKTYLPKVPGILVAVVITILLSWAIGFQNIGGMVVGDIPVGLPSFELPQMSLMTLTELSAVAIAIALIGFMEAISVSKAIAVSTRQRLDPNQELIGQGLSNVTASCFQAYAVSGSFSRSAVNFECGAKTGFSSVITGLVVASTLLFFTPLLYHLPQPTLAAVIIMAVAGLIRVKLFLHIWNTQKHDAIVAITTFVLTLLFAPHLEIGILVGVLLSLGLYVYRTMSPHISVLARHENGTLGDAGRHLLPQCPKICIIRFEGPLFFANTSYFENKILERVSAMPNLQFFIIDAVAINEIDATGEAMLHTLAEVLVNQKISFLFARIQNPVMQTLVRSGFCNDDWKEEFFTTRAAALEFAWKKMKQSGGNKDCTNENCQKRSISGCVLQKK